MFKNYPASKLLDFSQPLDINLLENVINTMHHGTGPQQQAAQELLNNLKDHPDAWTKVDKILQSSRNTQAKYYALQILEQFVKTRWKILPRNQNEGIKKFVIQTVIEISLHPTNKEKERVCLLKLNMVLVEILKHEWPNNWPNFIGDIVRASMTGESLCENNMLILKLFSEEVFDFSSGQMTQLKAKHLKEHLRNEFPQIFRLCLFVMDNSQNAQLVYTTLETLLHLLHCILGAEYGIPDYIFESNLISYLVKFLNVPMFRNVVLRCLTEIAGVSVTNHEEKFVTLFTQTMCLLKQILPLNTDVRLAYDQAKNEEQNFIHNLSLFLCTFQKVHGQFIERRPNLREMLMEALHYMLLLSKVEETEIFKICLEYWNHLAGELYRECSVSSTATPLLHCVPPRRQLYLGVLSHVRSLMVSRMAKPKEVLVVENDHGEVVREFMKDTDAINLYKTMRETLVYLTHLDYADTQRIMTEKLQNQVNMSDWGWRNLNALCWAIGSISGAMQEDDEMNFLVIVFKGLLKLCEQKRGQDKVIVASNMMYVVGQYPRFLRAHWVLLKVVVVKLFEFMHETHDGVQDMACDTFFMVAKKCRQSFVQVQEGEAVPFIDEILRCIDTIICDLQPQQIHTFFEAVGYMIAAQEDQAVQVQLIQKYMRLPNQEWDRIMLQATKNVDILKEEKTLHQLGGILKINVRACKAIGHVFIVQLGQIYLNMLNVYKYLSETISTVIQNNGEMVTKCPLIRSMMMVKRETLKLISGWVSCSDNPQVVANKFVPPLLDAVLLDYKKNVPAARDPEVLCTMATIVNSLGDHISGQIPQIFDAVFDCTWNMINKDFEEFPEHRINFFSLLRAAILKCFHAFLCFTPTQFSIVLYSVIWAVKHTMRNVANTGLQILYTILQNVSASEAVTERFYQTYFIDILQNILSVVTDSSHTARLTMHATILAHMLEEVEKGKAIPVNNQVHVLEYIGNLLKKVFPHLQDSQLKVFLVGLFSLNKNIPAFREHLRDFLVQIKEFTGEDTSHLFLEERELTLRQAQENKRNLQMSVPGMLGPHELQGELNEDEFDF
ncbi:exportin-1-like [Aulostomus maculatus]